MGFLWKCIALAVVIVCLTLPAFAQDTPVSAASLRERVLEVLANIDTLDPAVRVERILEAQAILARIETEFPESDEAILLLLDGGLGTLSKSELAEQLKAAQAESEAADHAADLAASGDGTSEAIAASPEDAGAAHDADALATSEGLATGVVALREADAPEQDILAQAVALNLGLEVMPSEAQGAQLAQIRGLLDQIVDKYPESDLALNIILQMPIDGIDPGEIDRRLAALVLSSPDPVPAPPTEPPPEEPPAQPTEMIFANLPAAVMACLSVGLQTPVELRVQIDISAEGEIVGVPQLLNQDQTLGDLREAYLRALLALDGCAPLQSEGGAGVVIVAISPDGLVMSESQMPQDAEIALVERTTATATEVTDPSLPAGALLPTDAGTEGQLKLSKKDVRQIQARLQVMGFDPNGIDGVLGQDARTAVRAWQAQNQLTETGYLGKAQLELLRIQSEAAYAEWFEVSANKKLIEAKGGSSVRTGRYIDARGCLREPNGRAVPNFKAGC